VLRVVYTCNTRQRAQIKSYHSALISYALVLRYWALAVITFIARFTVAHVYGCNLVTVTPSMI